MATTDSELIEINVRVPRAFAEAVIRHSSYLGGDVTGRRLALAKWMLAVRRRRSKAFKRVRLGEPSWDMILDLYIADREGRRIDVSGLCLASGIAPTTALRYVDLLVGEELIAKSSDALDGRRWFVAMTNALRTATDEWLDQAEAALSLSGWTANVDAMAAQAGDADLERSR